MFSHFSALGGKSPDITLLVKDNTDFALYVYRELRGTKGNLFFSPYSISTALAMAYAGARSNTEKEMAAALHFSLDQNKLHPAFAQLDSDLKKAREKGEIKLNVANSLWPQKGYPFLDTYLSLLERDYGVSITPVDYKSAPEKVRLQINQWVENKTEKKIQNLIGPGVLDPVTRMVLVNAIYFKGRWNSEFKAENTRIEPFYFAPDESISVHMMHQSDHFKYAEFPTHQMLMLPYWHNTMSMIILLPKDTSDIQSLESMLSSEKLAEWREKLKSCLVRVSLPKFTLTTDFRLDDALRELGMNDAFDPGTADFSGMDGRKGWLYINAVIHKAFVEVNERGTEAAAATAVLMRGCAMAPSKPVTFRADHPFLFYIQDNQTGTILFLGRLSKPDAAQTEK